MFFKSFDKIIGKPCVISAIGTQDYINVVSFLPGVVHHGCKLKYIGGFLRSVFDFAQTGSSAPSTPEKNRDRFAQDQIAPSTPEKNRDRFAQDQIAP